MFIIVVNSRFRVQIFWYQSFYNVQLYIVHKLNVQLYILYAYCIVEIKFLVLHTQ